MSLPIRKSGQRYTYNDYLSWDDGKRSEIIHGIFYDMTPAPLRKHQEIVGELFAEFRNYQRDKECRAYVAPFDVRLPIGDEQDEDIHEKERIPPPQFIDGEECASDKDELLCPFNCPTRYPTSLQSNK